MNLNFKNWINEQISNADLEKAVSGIINQITTTGTQTTSNNNSNTNKIITAVDKTNKSVVNTTTNIQKDLKDKTNLLTKILTGSNKTPNPNEKPENTNKKLADTIAQQVMLYMKANNEPDSQQANDTTTATAATTAQTNIKPPKAR